MPSSSDQRHPIPRQALTELDRVGDTGDETEQASDGFPRVSKLNLWLLLVSLTSLCAALYLSPVATECVAR